MKEWTFVNIVTDGQAINLGGINPWDHEWVKDAQKSIEVPHPQYPDQRHTMDVYKINTKEKSITFAAGEFSNCVWGFYVPSA